MAFNRTSTNMFDWIFGSNDSKELLCFGMFLVNLLAHFKPYRLAHVDEAVQHEHDEEVWTLLSLRFKMCSLWKIEVLCLFYMLQLSDSILIERHTR